MNSETVGMLEEIRGYCTCLREFTKIKVKLARIAEHLMTGNSDGLSAFAEMNASESRSLWLTDVDLSISGPEALEFGESYANGDLSTLHLKYACEKVKGGTFADNAAKYAIDINDTTYFFQNVREAFRESGRT